MTPPELENLVWRAYLIGMNHAGRAHELRGWGSLQLLEAVSSFEAFQRAFWDRTDLLEAQLKLARRQIKVIRGEIEQRPLPLLDRGWLWEDVA